MVANAEPWLGDIARRVATEEPKAEDTDDEDESWEDAKKSNEDGALDHIVASALKGAVPSRRNAVRALLLSNGVTSDVLIHASGFFAASFLPARWRFSTPHGLALPAARAAGTFETGPRRRHRRAGSAAGAQLVLHALDELAERHTPNGLHVGERLALATEVSHIVRRYAVDATTDETPSRVPPATPPPPPASSSPRTARSRATSPRGLGDPGE